MTSLAAAEWPGPDPMHGYTLADLDDLARKVVTAHAHWWGGASGSDLRDWAWEGIALRLAVASRRPPARVLLDAGRDAVAREIRDSMRHHGNRSDGTNTGQRHAMYWAGYSVPAPSPEPAIVERIAARQVLAVLTTRQCDALAALAATGDYWAAARMLGIRPQTFRSLIGRARRDFYALWFEGQEPPRVRGTDRRTARHDTSDPDVLERRARDAASARARRAVMSGRGVSRAAGLCPAAAR